jgi:hypothetical protein
VVIVSVETPQSRNLKKTPFSYYFGARNPQKPKRNPGFPISKTLIAISSILFTKNPLFSAVPSLPEENAFGGFEAREEIGVGRRRRR